MDIFLTPIPHEHDMIYHIIGINLIDEIIGKGKRVLLSQRAATFCGDMMERGDAALVILDWVPCPGRRRRLSYSVGVFSSSTAPLAETRDDVDSNVSFPFQKQKTNQLHSIHQRLCNVESINREKSIPIERAGFKTEDLD